MILIGRLLRGAAQLAALIGALALVAMMLQIAADVLARNLFSAPLPFTQTLVTRWHMVAAAFLPLALTEILDRHISVEVVFQTFSSRWRRIVGGAVTLYACAVACVVTWPLWREALKQAAAGAFELENGQAMPIWQPWFCLPAGFALLAAVLLYRAVILWTGAASGMGETRIDAEPDAANPHAGTGA